ncbi:hypothetical protein, partial [Falsiroseomonas oryzae]|uniref:hypothetical protein n=1 Tax=Falsiroseomonas oryzae TaxID=2766473 RepID=UPI0022EB77EB
MAERAERSAVEPGDAPVGRDDVVAAYRWILGRAPESEAAVTARIEGGVMAAQLRRRMLRSAEFRAETTQPLPPGLPPDAPAPAIGLEATPGEVAAMLARVARGWT